MIDNAQVDISLLHCNYIQWNYSGKWDTWKKCTLYKYLPYTVLQCRSLDVRVNHCKCYIYSTVLGAAIKCKQYSGITVEHGTRGKSVQITLNIFAVYKKHPLFSPAHQSYPSQVL